MKKIFVILVLAMICSMVKADETIFLTLEDARQIALKGNYDVLSNKENILLAEGKEVEALSGYLPKLSLNGNYNYVSKIPVYTMSFTLPAPINATMSQKISQGMNDNTVYKIGLTQNIFDWGRTVYNCQIAGLGKDMAKLDLDSVNSQVIFNVTSAFYNIILAKNVLSLQNESLKIAQDHMQRIENNFKQGTSSSFELMKSKVQVANIKPSVSKAYHNLDIAKINLKNLLGIQADKNIEVMGGLAEESYPENIIYESSLKSAEAQRPELSKIKKQQESARKALDVAKTTDKPVITANAGYQYQDPYYVQLEWVDYWSAGVNMSIPLFDGFLGYSKVKEAKAGVESIDYAAKNLNNMIGLEVRQAVYNLYDANEKIISQKETIKQAEEYIKIAKDSFKNGVITDLEVMDAELALLQARTAYLQALFEYTVAKNAYLKAIGELK